MTTLSMPDTARGTDGASLPAAETLRALGPKHLAARFESAPDAERVDVLDGDPTGLALALERPADGPLIRWARARAASPAFIWHGKSFRSHDRHGGVGWNRLGVGPILGGLPFETSIVLSQLDGRPAIGVHYDAPRVPWIARSMYDELREVEPGVFAGPGGVLRGSQFRVLFWFAVDTTRQIQEVRFAGSSRGH